LKYPASLKSEKNGTEVFLKTRENVTFISKENNGLFFWR